MRFAIFDLRSLIRLRSQVAFTFNHRGSAVSFSLAKLPAFGLEWDTTALDAPFLFSQPEEAEGPAMAFTLEQIPHESATRHGRWTATVSVAAGLQLSLLKMRFAVF
jgi:hypothetical protein